jgi:hypothetical protein
VAIRCGISVNWYVFEAVLAVMTAGSPTTKQVVRLATTVALIFNAVPAYTGNGSDVASSTVYVHSFDRPQLAQGYRSALGLKPPHEGGALLGPQSATTQLLARVAQAHTLAEPLYYVVERTPSGVGLRGTEQAVGVVLHSGQWWSSSLEVSSAESLVLSSRRMALLGQLHAPFAGGVGVSAGVRYSSLQPPGYLGIHADSPYGNGYLASSGRADASGGQLGYQFQLNYLYGQRNSVALTYGTRRDGEQIRLGSDPMQLEGSQFSVTGEHWFSPSWALRYDIPTPDPGTIRRQGLRLGVHYRF